MTCQQILYQVFTTGRFEPQDEVSKANLAILVQKGVLNPDGTENREAIDKILYPNKDKPICGYCRRQGNMSTHSPYCGHFCNSNCLVQHTKQCRACAISIAMEK